MEASSAYLGDLDQVCYLSYAVYNANYIPFYALQMQLQLPPSTQSLDASFSGEQSLPRTVSPSVSLIY